MYALGAERDNERRTQGEVLLRTPAAAEAAGGPRNPNRPGATMRLSDQVREEQTRGVLLLKTPTSQLAVNGGSQHPDKRKAGGHGPTLADEVEHLLPTPMAADSDRTSPTFSRGNPTLLGATTSPLFDGGNGSQDE
jgi:hypothetical protein